MCNEHYLTVRWKPNICMVTSTHICNTSAKLVLSATRTEHDTARVCTRACASVTQRISKYARHQLRGPSKLITEKSSSFATAFTPRGDAIRLRRNVMIYNHANCTGPGTIGDTEHLGCDRINARTRIRVNSGNSCVTHARVHTLVRNTLCVTKTRNTHTGRADIA